LVDAALSVGQWLADQAILAAGQGQTAAILRCLDFLPNSERERFLFSFVGLLDTGTDRTDPTPAPSGQSTKYPP